MSAYVIVDIAITDPLGYAEYLRISAGAIRHQAARSNMIVIEGI